MFSIFSFFPLFLKIQAPKKRKDKVQMKEINAGTEYEYGDVNIQMTSYDMCLVEHFAQYVHKLCNRLSIKVNERYEEHSSVLVIPHNHLALGHVRLIDNDTLQTRAQSNLSDRFSHVNPNLLSSAWCSLFVCLYGFGCFIHIRKAEMEFFRQ